MPWRLPITNMVELIHGGESGIFTPNRQTVFGFVHLTGLDFLLAGTYVLARAIRITNPLILLYPFLWIDVNLLAVLTTIPHPETTRQRLIGIGIAGGNFPRVGILRRPLRGGKQDGSIPRRLGTSTGYSPIVSYEVSLLRLSLQFYKVVGYVGLAYLVDITVVDTTRAAVSGVIGLFACVSCSWPILGTVATGFFGNGSAVAAVAPGSRTDSVCWCFSRLLTCYTIGCVCERPTVHRNDR